MQPVPRPSPQRTKLPTGLESLQWIVTDDGSRTLWDERLDETYHSGCGAVAETLIVYLWHSGVLQRLRQGQATVVLEYGLGTGTGLLLTAAIAEHYRTPLHFVSLELNLLPCAVLQQLDLPRATAGCLAGGFAKTPQEDPGFTPKELAALPRLANRFWSAVEEWNHCDVRGWRQQKLSEHVAFELWLGDAGAWHVAERAEMTENQAPHHLATQQSPLGADNNLFRSCDAIYFDLFSPETQPDLWTLPVFRTAASALRPGGRLTSYCVKSTVRRGLQEAGLTVAKGPGPLGGKREVLIATR